MIKRAHFLGHAWLIEKVLFPHYRLTAMVWLTIFACSVISQTPMITNLQRFTSHLNKRSERSTAPGGDVLAQPRQHTCKPGFIIGGAQVGDTHPPGRRDALPSSPMQVSKVIIMMSAHQLARIRDVLAQPGSTRASQAPSWRGRR